MLTQPCVRLHLVQRSPIKIITRYQIPDELQFRQRCQHRDFEGGTLLCYQIEDYWQQLHANNFVNSKNTAAGSAESLLLDRLIQKVVIFGKIKLSGVRSFF